MKALLIKEHPEYRKDVGDLYISAFPEDERPPLSYFFHVHDITKDNNIIAYFDENQFIGFASIVTYKDIVYVCYLAVKEDKRNKGYGTQILKSIGDTYQNSVILICFEEVDEKYLDYDNRLKRMRFYNRNGYIDNGLKTKESDVIYQSAYNGDHRVSYEEYTHLFDLCYGDVAHKKYLKCVMKYS